MILCTGTPSADWDPDTNRVVVLIPSGATPIELALDPGQAMHLSQYLELAGEAGIMQRQRESACSNIFSMRA